MVDMQYDASEHQSEDIFEPIPAGWYECFVSDTEIRETKSGNGRYLQVELTVESGDYRGRRLWDRLNLWNPNQTAVDIANRQFSQLIRACGMVKIEDSEQIHNIPVLAKVKIQPARDEYDASNTIGGYKTTQKQQSVPKAEKSAPKAENKSTPPGAGARKVPVSDRNKRAPWQR